MANVFVLSTSPKIIFKIETFFKLKKKKIIDHIQENY